MGLLIFYVLLALLISFLCSILEAVLLSVTPGYIETQAKLGKGYAALLTKMKEKVDESLSAILTLNTIAHTMGAAGAGAQWKAMYDDTGEAIFAGVLTLLVLVFSEIIPKTIGAKFWRSLAGPTTYVLRGMIWILTWLPPWPLPAMNWITRLIGGHSANHGVSRAELMAMAEMGSRSGQLEQEEGRILTNLFMLKSWKVRDIMTPRTVVYALPETTTVDEFLSVALQKPFSRIPVFKQTRDDITGFVLKSDVMAVRVRGEEESKAVSDFSRPIKAITSDASIYEAFKIMSEENHHLMLVLDQFGGMEGIVTMEDVVETLLGMEIVDEVDREEDMQKLARRLWSRRAKAMGLEIEERQSVETDSNSE